MAVDSLTAEDIAILAMEKEWWQQRGTKEDAIRERFGMTPTRYYARLHHLIYTRAALERDPVTVNRLRRIAQSRQDARQFLQR